MLKNNVKPTCQTTQNQLRKSYAKSIEVKKGVAIKAASIEVLVVSKFRAAAKRQGADNTDIRTLTYKKYKDIDWNILKLLTRNEIEFQTIKNQMDALYRM